VDYNNNPDKPRGTFWLSPAQSNPKFFRTRGIYLGLMPGDFVVGDFNGDGRVDLAIGSVLSYQVCMFFNNGNGQFTRSFFASGAFLAPIIAADLNHNGKLDLVIANYGYIFAPFNVNVVFHQGLPLGKRSRHLVHPTPTKEMRGECEMPCTANGWQVHAVAR
jgi:FG-GAP-like repeat